MGSFRSVIGPALHPTGVSRRSTIWLERRQKWLYFKHSFTAAASVLTWIGVGLPLFIFQTV
jgi:uncharacterized membrane protein YccF (DUF307 family)